MQGYKEFFNLFSKFQSLRLENSKKQSKVKLKNIFQSSRKEMKIEFRTETESSALLILIKF